MAGRVLVSFLQQETNTFSDQCSSLENFENGILLFGEDIRKAREGTATDWGAVFAAAEMRDWDLVTPIYAHAQPSGVLGRIAFEQLIGPIIEACSDGVTGVLLMLHGSMVADDVEDCEGELLARLRSKTGNRVPIVVTLDPHANVSRRMADAASALIAYRTTPHVDQVETTQRAIELLDRLLTEPLRASVLLGRPRTLSGLDSGRTIQGGGPMVDVLRQAAEIEREPGVLAVSIQAGFGFSDTPEIGPSAAMTVVEPTSRHEASLAFLVSEIWRTRGIKTIKMLEPSAAMAAAIRSRGEGPAVVVDYADNPGGGAPGDDTTILSELLKLDPERSVFFAIHDPVSVAKCLEAGIGGQVALELGGRSRAASRTGCARVSAKVVAASDGRYMRRGAYFNGTEGNLGASVMVAVGRVSIVVTSIPSQTEERGQLQLFGLEPGRLDIIVCKAMNHFRADIEPFARAIFYADCGGLCSPDQLTRSYSRVRRPIWPLDRDVPASAHDEIGASLQRYSALVSTPKPYGVVSGGAFRPAMAFVTTQQKVLP